MTTHKTRTRTGGDAGNTPHAAALRRQLAGLAALEKTPIYQEMCASADARVRAESALPKDLAGRTIGQVNA